MPLQPSHEQPRKVSQAFDSTPNGRFGTEVANIVVSGSSDLVFSEINMGFQIVRRTRQLLLAGLLGPLALFQAQAVTTFVNPVSNISGVNASNIGGYDFAGSFTFTATDTGTLQGFFTGGQRFTPEAAAFLNSVAVVVNGSLSGNLASGNLANLSYGPDNTSNFGTQLFNNIAVNRNDIITFVLKSVPDNGSTQYIRSSDRNQNNSAFSEVYSTVLTSDSGGFTGRVCGAGGTANDYRGCVGNSSRNGTIAAGTYTYVGFSDQPGGPSNGYWDFGLLARVVCAGNTGFGNISGGAQNCTNTPTPPPPTGVPEPTTLALVAVALLCAAKTRKRGKAPV